MSISPYFYPESALGGKSPGLRVDRNTVGLSSGSLPSSHIMNTILANLSFLICKMGFQCTLAQCL